MAATRSWLKQENDDITRILYGFWERRIKNKDPSFNKLGFKGFVSGAYRSEWTDKVDRSFEDAVNSADNFEKFRSFFGDWFTSDDALVIDRNHLPQPEERATLTVSMDDKQKLKRYLADTKSTAAVCIGNAKSQFEPVIVSEDIHQSSPFIQIHSLTKMFTGALALKFIENQWIPEDQLMTPLGKSSFFNGFIQSLPEAFRKQFGEHLSKVSLFQLMSHQAGLGDYYESSSYDSKGVNTNSYQKAINDALESKKPVPAISSIADLLKYSEQNTYDIGNFHYSNVGITLVGMILEFAYQKKFGENVSFNDILYEVLLKKAGINHADFTQSMPKGGLYNTSELADKAAPHIIAGPAGYYWTRVEELAQFGKWLHDEYHTNNKFQHLVSTYGGEFLDPRNKKIASHTGTLTASSSAFLSISFETGNIIAIACTNSDQQANSLEASIKRHIYSEHPQYMVEREPYKKLSSMAAVVKALSDDHPEEYRRSGAGDTVRYQPVNEAKESKELPSSVEINSSDDVNHSTRSRPGKNNS